MDTRPSGEQRELADSADRLAAKLGPNAVGDLDDTDRRQRLDAALAQAGWRELRTGTSTEPMASGIEAAIVCRALARRACDTAFIGPVLAHDLLRRAGGDGSQVAPAVVVNRDLTKLASSPNGGLAIDVSDDSAVMLNASGAVCLVTPGEAVNTVDLTRAVASVVADSAMEQTLGVLGADGLAAFTALAVTLTAADLVGVMEGAVQLAADYAKERRQYGAAIGSFQAVQHMLAEAKTLTEGAASALVHAAWAVDALPPDQALQAAAVAKAYASRAALTVCETAIQVHGGIGNTWECMAHVFLRRALLSSELFGGEGPQMALLSHQRWGANNGLS